MTQDYSPHLSVLYNECLDLLINNRQTDLVFADMTFGAGGHTFGLARSSNAAKVYAVDQDPDAILNGKKIIQENNLGNRIILIKDNYVHFPSWVENNISEVKFDGILMDLGVSSHHFDEFTRGFSFREDAFLDMRMAYDNDAIETAAEFLETASESEIADVIYKYGEERLSRRIAKLIVEEREKNGIKSTKQLENICFHAYPKSSRHSKTHPATRTFQALRIYVNRELEVLEDTIEKLFGLLNEGGRLAIISFHSLEDRIVKHKYKEIFQNNKNIAKIITKKPIVASLQEVERNSRSRSAKLRVIEKNSMEGASGKKKYKKES